MSHAASPSTERLYGVVRVSQEWEIPRSSFYAARQRQQQPACSPVRRGPKTRYSDQELLQHIRAVIDQGPFSGEGHRKIWARLRFQAIRTSKGRVLRLMRLANLLAPARRPPQVDLHESLSAQQENALLQLFDRVVLMRDGDAAGRAASRAIAARLSARCSLAVVQVPDGAQPDQLSLTAIQELLGGRETRQTGSVNGQLIAGEKWS